MWLIVLRLRLKKAVRSYSSTNSRKRNKAFIALGSNKGNRINYFKYAISEIGKNSKIQIVKCASVYETKAYGEINQPNFLNSVLEIRTSHNLKELFTFLKDTEVSLGRTANERWGKREIDLDLLFFNDDIFMSDVIRVPHYGIQDRDFVLIPLKEIAPSFVHPVLNRKISDICKDDISNTLIRKTRYKIN